ncbi:peroxiredoxin [Salisediminibacterium halotolerans]|uniref:Alkyl hydroperoxide reductase subunit AhpC (Peroxiredoxin) n=1 Tax=Salisediminibacterium halotolerans TaxID=517425 RepID=A0A1H9S2K8_9BACI|nr:MULTISPECIES: peroxiredoxin [Salisediminibacterium]RLJ78199.1 alkyl hydroperoxide reductase subunit AhpC [Actinophytocola xinjiangensis]RPE88462.1 alkyl hydroperoxide reductase subunit AhpC [Salisediminibacterium halotolerans]TWG37176.1 alkyl hydroperoxide reductase subunit AhpC [Salisediminibacterium halotolerans]SER79231.1 Alkyl hydroperoxide reductase subunit AhpC (peroxiredoxin) [Salisediminibacterium haloalkalitolerans]GEL09003.1 thioredoxin-like protein YkuU [Salisediminibacterium hal
MSEKRMVGKQAPRFEMNAVLPDKSMHKITLEEIMKEDKWTVLFFYPMDFTPVCLSEITSLSDRFKEFEKLDVDIIGISTDSVQAHSAWINTPRTEQGLEKLAFPLASDANHRVSHEYGVLMEDEGFALRGLFIISPEGELQYSVIHTINTGRNVDEILRVIQALQAEGFCPADWSPGQETL